MRRELLFVAAGMAALALTAQVVNWRGVSVNTATGIANVTNIGFRGQVTASSFVGRGDGLTGVAKPETNWWAVFTIEDPEALKPYGYPRWSDITLKCWTNGPVHFGGHNPVFCYTTTDPALNGMPSWESFTTNWYPRVFYCQVHAYWDITWLAEWKHLSPTHGDSLYDTIASWDSEDSASFPFRWVVMVRDTRAWFHPTNNLSWAYTLQDNTSHPTIRARDGSTPLTQAPWYKVVPMWVTYDPRPRKAREFWVGGAALLQVTNQHQRP